ncbi:MAG: DUF5688 family protein [Waltera sp.]
MLVCFLNGLALNQIAEELNSNLFIYPSSIHEVLILPDEGTRKQRRMQKEMVEEVNESNVSRRRDFPTAFIILIVRNKR